VVQENCVVRATAQHLARLGHIVRNINLVALKTCRKPFVTPGIVVQQKHANWMSLRLD
jgi:hypothetical protein